MAELQTAQRLYAELLDQARVLGQGAASRLIAELALRDVFFLMSRLLGRTDINTDWLYARCREVQQNPDGYLDLWAREHYKSTIITVGLTIQEIIKNPEITVGIFSHSRPIAKSFLRQIKREFEGNRALQLLFPHIKPPQQGEKRTWSEDEGMVVRRRGNKKEATIEAWGLVDGQPIGRHFDLLVYDDVVTPESVTSPEMIKKTSDAWRISLNLGTRGGKVRMIGTRYHATDTYAEIIEQGSVVREARGLELYPEIEKLAQRYANLGQQGLPYSEAGADKTFMEKNPWFYDQVVKNLPPGPVTKEALAKAVGEVLHKAQVDGWLWGTNETSLGKARHEGKTVRGLVIPQEERGRIMNALRMAGQEPSEAAIQEHYRKTSGLAGDW